MIDWILNLTPHQLDVLRTVSVVIGGGCVPLFGFLLTWFARVINRNTKKAVSQTATTQFVNGELRPTSVVDYVRHAATTTEATRQEVSDFYQEWVKGTGKRRLPTTEIPPISQAEGHSHYE